MWGGSGSDLMNGGPGLDYFVWGKADGNDTICGHSQDDVMLYNTKHGDYGLSLSGDNLVVAYDNADSLTVLNWKNNANATNTFTFAAEWGQSYKVADSNGKLSWTAV